MSCVLGRANTLARTLSPGDESSVGLSPESRLITKSHPALTSKEILLVRSATERVRQRTLVRLPGCLQCKPRSPLPTRMTPRAVDAVGPERIHN